VSAIESFEARLAQLKRTIQDGTRAEIDALLGEGCAWFDGEPDQVQIRDDSVTA
jgi:hypothetical protein